jgi:hypothetical protein
MNEADADEEAPAEDDAVEHGVEAAANEEGPPVDEEGPPANEEGDAEMQEVPTFGQNELDYVALSDKPGHGICIGCSRKGKETCDIKWRNIVWHIRKCQGISTEQIKEWKWLCRDDGYTQRNLEGAKKHNKKVETYRAPDKFQRAWDYKEALLNAGGDKTPEIVTICVLLSFFSFLKLVSSF